MLTKFELNETEAKAAEEFFKKHHKCYKQSTIGGGYAHEFWPNGIGTGVIVKCSFCGETEDITDISCW